MKKKSVAALLLALCCTLSACTSAAPGAETESVQPTQEETQEVQQSTEAPVFVDEMTMEDVEIGEEMIPMATNPAAVPIMLVPVASGTKVAKANGAEIDYSNTKDGYVMVRFPGSSAKALKVRVTGPSGTNYDYNLPVGSAWSTFPLSDGNGAYKVMALQNTTGKKYAVLATASFTASMTDQFAPFLRPNQYVNYEGAVNTIAKAAELTGSIADPLEKVAAVYNYVVKTLTYDKARAQAVSSGQLTGYLPDLDSVLAKKQGICFDYAALMTGMLRSQGVPCKLVVGYAGDVYHAWVSVWTETTGWVDNAIFFDGTTWHRMDPTFASSGNKSDAIMKFIGNGTNYSTKYLY